ncbi:hypothetical protein KCP74_12250 [Salmonella enterica subsp. enterica]|nr:hypothetical protein KCP74_12250 [Salmonella enterica subsp. enterica]
MKRWSSPLATVDNWRNAIVTRNPLMLRLLEQARMVAHRGRIISVLINGQKRHRERDFRAGDS